MIKRLILSILLSFLLCGCVDYSELNMQKLVSGAGIDRRDGKTLVSIVSVSMSGDKESETVRAMGESFFDAVRKASSQTDKKLYWGHAMVLVVGEEALGDMEGILDTVSRARDIYPDIAILGAKGVSAEEILYSPEGEDIPEKIYNMFANEKNSGRFSQIRLWEILRDLSEKGTYIIPTVEKSDGGIKLSGGAVMGRDKLLGYLSGEEILLRSIVSEGESGGFLPPLGNERGTVSFELVANHSRVKSGEDIRIKLVLTPSEVRGELKKEEMEGLAREYLEKGIRSLLRRSEREGFGDILSLGEKASPEDVKISCSVRISDITGGEK